MNIKHRNTFFKARVYCAFNSKIVLQYATQTWIMFIYMPLKMQQCFRRIQYIHMKT